MAKIGDRIDRYELRALLGRGGAGQVFRVHDSVLGRDVALKLLLASSPTAEDTSRFLNEAKALAAVKHRNIVAIYDIGVCDGDPYFTMELIEGHALAELLAQGRRFTYDEVRQIVVELASAIDYLHLHGIVHRDIKDTNVMLTDDGHAMLMDFGIALIGGARLTQTGYGVGTFYSAAPEQITGRDVGPAVDIYALGILTYQLLTGHPPFEGEPVRVLYAQAHDAPPPLRSIRPGLPRSVYAVVAQALAKSPAQRPASARAFAAAFEEAGGTPRASLSLPRLPGPTRDRSMSLSPRHIAARQHIPPARQSDAAPSPIVRRSLPILSLPAPIAPRPLRAAADAVPGEPQRRTGRLRGVPSADERGPLPSWLAVCILVAAAIFVATLLAARSRSASPWFGGPSQNQAPSGSSLSGLSSGAPPKTLATEIAIRSFTSISATDVSCCLVSLEDAVLYNDGTVALHLAFAVNPDYRWTGDAATADAAEAIATLGTVSGQVPLISVEGDAAKKSGPGGTTSGWYTFGTVPPGETDFALHYRHADLYFTLGDPAAQ